jgi:hypothetical protein
VQTVVFVPTTPEADLPARPGPALPFVGLADHDDQALADSVYAAWYEAADEAARRSRTPAQVLARARFALEIVPLAAFAGQFPRDARFYLDADDDPERYELVKRLTSRYRRALPVPPVVATSAGGRWRILDGQHRLTAAYLAGLKAIPVHRLAGFAD